LATRKPEERPLQRIRPCLVPSRPRSVRAAPVELVGLRGLRSARRRKIRNRAVCLAMPLGCRSLVFPAPFLGLRPLPAGTLEGHREHRLPGSEPPGASTSVTFTSPSMRPHTVGNPSRHAGTEVPSETRVPASPGVRPLSAPPPMHRPRVHSRRPKPPSGRRHHPFRLAFRPRGFSPPRRFPPRSGCGFVAPRYRSGVRRVSRRRLPEPPERDTGEPTPFPATRAHTLRRVPPVDSRTTSPRSLAFTVAVALLPLPPDPRGDRGRRAACRAPPRRSRALR
jgi:hypothetical protein